MAGSTGTTPAGSARSGATSAAKASRSAWLAGRAPSISSRQTSSSGRRSASSIGRVLAVVVEALVAADVADLGVGHDHALQPSGHLRRTDLGHPHEVAERHDADQLAAPDHRHVAVARARASVARATRGSRSTLDGVDRVGHDVADREVAEVLGRGDPDDVALGHDADGAGAVDDHDRADPLVVHALHDVLERLGGQCADRRVCSSRSRSLIVSIVRSRRDVVNVDYDQPMRTLTAAEAAKRLGVKVETLYAYVSRGVLRSTPRPRRPVEPVRRRRRGGHRPAGSTAAGEPAARRSRSRSTPTSPRSTATLFASEATTPSSWRPRPRSNRSRSCSGPVPSRSRARGPGPLCRWPCPRAAASATGSGSRSTWRRWAIPRGATSGPRPSPPAGGR